MKIKQVADLLGVCEFDLFRQAHAAWYQGSADDEAVGVYFTDYADDGVVPFWVSAYVKVTLESSGPVQAVA